MGEKEFSTGLGQRGALVLEAQAVLRIYLLTEDKGKERNLVETVTLSSADRKNLPRCAHHTAGCEAGVVFSTLPPTWAE